MSSIAGNSIVLRDIFGDRFFRVPSYQRGYAWGEKQLSEFWQDLDDLPKNHKHYTGSIFVRSSDDVDTADQWLIENGLVKYDVVDGQQRLTTVVILLHELISALGDDEGYLDQGKSELRKRYVCRERLNGTTRSFIFNYMSDNQNHSHMLASIFEEPNAIQQANPNAYSRNLDFAKSFFRERLEDLQHPEREVLFSKVTNRLIFDLRDVEKELDVESVFETMNNRGKKLTILERLKNRLFYLTNHLAVNSSDEKTLLKAKINQAWAVIYEEIGKDPEVLLDEDDFFVAHLSLIRTPQEAVFSEEAAEKKIFEMFSIRSSKFDEPTVTFGVIEDYVVGISRAVKAWHQLHVTRNGSPLQKILVLRSNREVKILLLAVLLETDDSKLQNELFAKIESLLFRNHVPGGGVFDERQLAYRAREIHMDEKELDLERLGIWLQELIDRPLEGSSFVEAVQYLFSYQRGAKGFHRWGDLNYFLYEYDEALKVQFKERQSKLDFATFDSSTIEHVIPQNWRNNWRKAFKGVRLTPSNEGEMTKVMINTLGNLTVLFDGKNSSLGDKPWADKQERYCTGSYNEIEISQNETWDLAEIRDRGFKLIDFLKEKVPALSLTEEETYQALFVHDKIINAVRNL